MPYIPEASINHCYARNRYTGKPVLKRAASKWKSVLQAKVAAWIDDNGIKLKPNQQVIIRLYAYFPKRKGSKPDGDNFIKLAQDSIANAFGVGQRGDYRFLSQVAIVTHDDTTGGHLVYQVAIEDVVKAVES